MSGNIRRKLIPNVDIEFEMNQDGSMAMAVVTDVGSSWATLTAEQVVALRDWLVALDLDDERSRP